MPLYFPDRYDSQQVVAAEASGLTTATYKTPAEIMGWTAVGMTPVLTNGALVVNCGAQADAVLRQVRGAQAGITELVACLSFSMLCGIPVGHPMWGVSMVDGSGSGVMGSFYSNSSVLLLGGVSAYAYASTISQATLPAQMALNQGVGKLWLKLTRAGTSYAFSYSLDGKIWADPLTGTQAGTPTTAVIGQFYRYAGTSILSSKLIIHGAAVK